MKMSSLALAAIVAAVLCLSTAPAMAQATTWVNLGGGAQGLLYEPNTGVRPKTTAFIYEHTDEDNFTDAVATQIVTRGYKILMVDARNVGTDDPEESDLPSISRGIAYLRTTVPGIAKVVLISHSGGGHLAALYVNVAQNGPGACSGPEKIVPCATNGLTNLQVPDAWVSLDGTIGAGHNMSSIDPAVIGPNRGDLEPSLDMLSTTNGSGYNANGTATYTTAFKNLFYPAQSNRSNFLIDYALGRLALINANQGDFTNDEPIVLRGFGPLANGFRLYQPDVTLQMHTKDPHMVLKADGTRPTIIFNSVRPPTTGHLAARNNLGTLNYETTVKGFLANSALRTDPATYAFTADDIVGVDWCSAYVSTPCNARGITIPTLFVAMGCHYLIVPAEIVYNNLKSADKTYVGVEGAVHGFTPCNNNPPGANYGDTRARLFDYVSEWVSARF